MYSAIELKGPVEVRMASPTVYRLYPHGDIPAIYGEWGWYSLDELSQTVLYKYERLVGGNAARMKYHTLFPVSTVKGPYFSWIIKNRDGSWIYETGDFAFCPFPTVTDYSVRRHQLKSGDLLFVPARWGETVIDFAKSGFMELGCLGVSSPVYYAIDTEGNQVPFSEDDALEFGPPRSFFPK